jgi:hypothetical protein
MIIQQGGNNALPLPLRLRRLVATYQKQRNDVHTSRHRWKEASDETLVQSNQGSAAAMRLGQSTSQPRKGKRES